MNKTSVNVELAIDGDDFDLEEVSAYLGLTPSWQWRKGDIKKIIPLENENAFMNISMILRRKRTNWCLDTGHKETYDISEQAQKLLDIIGGKSDGLRRLQNEKNVRVAIIFVIYVYDNITPAMTIERELIDFAHASNVIIDIDMYFY